MAATGKCTTCGDDNAITCKAGTTSGSIVALTCKSNWYVAKATDAKCT